MNHHSEVWTAGKQDSHGKSETTEESNEDKKIRNPYENRFYLGFNKDTGELVDVVAPESIAVPFHPDHFKALHEAELDSDTRNKYKDSLGKIRGKIRASSIPPKRLVFIDDPGNSICGGSCGGIPFELPCT
jgi:hypothetical protein